MKNYAEIARDNFLKGYNCAQAVTCAFCEEMQLEEAAVARMVSGFGGGMGKLREVCGAFSGAVFVLSTLKGYDDPAADQEKSNHYALVQQLAARFKADHETIICRELLAGIELKKEHTHEPEARTPEYYRTRPCARFVETAARICGEMLAE